MLWVKSQFDSYVDSICTTWWCHDISLTFAKKKPKNTHTHTKTHTHAHKPCLIKTMWFIHGPSLEPHIRLDCGFLFREGSKEPDAIRLWTTANAFVWWVVPLMGNTGIPQKQMENDWGTTTMGYFSYFIRTNICQYFETRVIERSNNSEALYVAARIS